MTMLAQEAKQLLRPPLEKRMLTPIQSLRGIPAWNSHRLLLAFCVYGGADHTLGIEVDPEVVTDRNDLVFEPIGALVGRAARRRLPALTVRLGLPRPLLGPLAQVLRRDIPRVRTEHPNLSESIAHPPHPTAPDLSAARHR